MAIVRLRVKLRLAVNNTFAILRRPTYAFLAIVAALLIAGVVIWSLNYQLVGYILFEAPLSFVQKVRFFAYGYESLFTTYNSLLSLSILLLSVLFGINTAVLTYALRTKTASNRDASKGGAAALLGILSSGCAACGTSLLTPLLATLGATSATFVQGVGVGFSLLGSLLLAYSIYKLALQTPAAKR